MAQERVSVAVIPCSRARVTFRHSYRPYLDRVLDHVRYPKLDVRKRQIELVADYFSRIFPSQQYSTILDLYLLSLDVRLETRRPSVLVGLAMVDVNVGAEFST